MLEYINDPNDIKTDSTRDYKLTGRKDIRRFFYKKMSVAQGGIWHRILEL